MRLKCCKNDPESGGLWTREVTFPFPPFPGLFVGWHVVEEVHVCQGGLDGEGSIEVIMDDAKPKTARVLEMQGWVFNEKEE